MPQGRYAPINLADLYTRLIVVNSSNGLGNCSGDCTQTAPPETVRAYELEKRGWLSRLAFNRKIAITTLASVTLLDPPVPVPNLPLFSISHDSVHGQGETFATYITGSDVQTPLFRLTANTAMTIHLNTSISDQRTFSVSAALISAVQTAVKIAAPASSIYTALSKTEVANTAKGLDSALNGMFSQSITEDIQIGTFSSGWNLQAGNKPALDFPVSGYVPGDLVKAESDATLPDGSPQPDHKIGTWHIAVLCPRPSIFDARDICSGISTTDPVTDATEIATLVKATKVDILHSVTASQVLTTHLSSGTTIQDFIKQQQFYTAFIGKTGAGTDDTNSFCTATVDALYTAGLSQFDAVLVLWAMDKTMPGVSTLAEENRIGTVCHTGSEDTINLKSTHPWDPVPPPKSPERPSESKI